MTTHPHAAAGRSVWPLLITAAAILMITMGIRQSLGLFISPLNTATGLGIVAISFAMAIGQFTWGVSQPLFGAIADRWGPTRVLMVGAVLLAVGVALTPFVTSQWMLLVTIGLLTSAGAGAGSFSILIGATSGRLPPEKRAFASGFINAGGSFGQFLFARLNQALIGRLRLGHGAAVDGGRVALATIPLASRLVPKAQASAIGGAHPQAAKPGAHVQEPGIGLVAQLRIAARDRSYWCLHAGFFTCGFHVAFLVTHLPGEVQLCGLSAGIAASSLAIIGLANIAGSLIAGTLGGRYRMKWLLFWMYATRAVAIGIYLAAPKTAATFYVFAFRARADVAVDGPADREVASASSSARATSRRSSASRCCPTRSADSSARGLANWPS